MTRRPRNSHTAAPTAIRCAIYTRKSTEEGLEQEFNSLDAQRDAGEAYVTSQKHEGWECMPDRYDDGGYTGGNMERPALKRLLADIEAGRIDCVVVYKVDRLSRSLLDFSRIVERFDRNSVSFVSVTQQFNTASSMGRLMLNVLLSFAQFEREIISERTRDKIAATRRKGKWSGGMPVLGYDVVRTTGATKLVVNADEAARVRRIFQTYLDEQSLIGTLKRLDGHGWMAKQWTTRKGDVRGGEPFNKGKLHSLLTNPVYLGKVRYKDEIHEGEHEAIVPIDLWTAVQTALERNGRDGGAHTPGRNKHNALLKGLLFCRHCGYAMGASYTCKGSKRYRYYVCGGAQKRGWHTCPAKSIPAPAAEQFVVEQIRRVGADPDLVRQTLAKAAGRAEQRIAELREEEDILAREMRRHTLEVRSLTTDAAKPVDTSRLAELQERIASADQRATSIREEIGAHERGRVTEEEIVAAVAAFDPVWSVLASREQRELIQMLIERIEFDAVAGEMSVTFHPTGLRALAQRHAAPGPATNEAAA